MITTTTKPDGNISTTTKGWDPSGIGLYYVKKQDTNGNTVTDYFNSANQKVEETSIGYNGTLLTTLYTYNVEGKDSTVLLPGYSTATVKTYQSDGRLYTEKGINTDLKYMYSGASTTTTNNISGETETQTVDGLGNVISVNGTKGNIAYQYYGSGKVKKITPSGSPATTMTYDVWGNQLSLTDPDVGTYSYIYDGFGELTSQKDNIDNVITCAYDTTGRLQSKTGTNLSVSYTYYNTQGFLGLLKSETRDGTITNYTYDGLSRPITITTSCPNLSFSTNYQYNTASQLYHVINPTGLVLEYVYDAVGNVIKINNATNSSNVSKIWSGDAKNNRNQWTNFSFGNSLSTTWGYDPNNYTLTSIKSGTSSVPTSIQNLGFTFNNAGQLTNRTDGTLSESFGYDAFDRLVSSNVQGQSTTFAVKYTSDGNGNIDSTVLAGKYIYSPNVHAVNNVAGLTGTPTSGQIQTSSTFTTDNKISSIDNTVYKDNFTYGPGNTRLKVDIYQNGSQKYSKYYIGNNEFFYDSKGTYLCDRTIVHAPTGICAIYQDTVGQSPAMYYIHTDYLGSWLAITNQSGSLTNKYSYDSWGRPRDPGTWKLLPVNVASALVSLNNMQPRFDHGYTGHEQMCGFGLVNMDGRLYDPYLQRFLSPDNELQDPSNTQNYNRYSYCLNNPLRFTDPSGNEFGISYDSWEGLDDGYDSFFANDGTLDDSSNPTYDLTLSPYYFSLYPQDCESASNNELGGPIYLSTTDVLNNSGEENTTTDSHDNLSYLSGIAASPFPVNTDINLPAGWTAPMALPESMGESDINLVSYSQGGGYNQTNGGGTNGGENIPLIQTSEVAGTINGVSWLWGAAQLTSENLPARILPRSGFNNLAASEAAGELIGKICIGINVAATVADGYDLVNNWDNAGRGDVAKFGVDATLTTVSTVLYLSGVGAPIGLILTGVQIANSLGAFDSIYGSFNQPLQTNRGGSGSW